MRSVNNGSDTRRDTKQKRLERLQNTLEDLELNLHFLEEHSTALRKLQGDVRSAKHARDQLQRIRNKLNKSIKRLHDDELVDVRQRLREVTELLERAKRRLERTEEVYRAKAGKTIPRESDHWSTSIEDVRNRLAKVTNQLAQLQKSTNPPTNDQPR